MSVRTWTVAAAVGGLLTFALVRRHRAHRA